MAIWTQLVKDELRALAATGLSASQCAALFPGMTRNAAIGLGHRNSIKFLGMGSGRKLRERKPRRARISKLLSVYEEPMTLEPPREGMLTINDLQHDSCRFIHGEVQDPNHRYCGQKTLGHYRWCAAHCGLVYSLPEHRLYVPNIR